MAQQPWHRAAVGGMWEEIGALQFDFLVSQGLRPDHFLLDVGCGSLRGGRHFIAFLEAGRYFGVDKNEVLIRAGLDDELEPELREAKRPTIELMDDFGFERLGQPFNYALAQSVFTHIDLNSILRCLENVRRVLQPGGKFFATYSENPDIRNLDPIQRGGIRTRPDRDPYHYPVSVFSGLTEMQMEHIGDWGHPRGQKMLCFTKKG